MAAGESHLVAGFGRRLFPVRSGATLSSSSATTSAIWSANSLAVVAGDVKIREFFRDSSNFFKLILFNTRKL